MTLKFRSLDLKAPGSHKLRRKIMQLVLNFRKAGLEEDAELMIAVEQDVEDVLKSFAYTDDGTSIEEAFDNISEMEYQQAIAGILNSSVEDPS